MRRAAAQAIRAASALILANSAAAHAEPTAPSVGVKEPPANAVGSLQSPAHINTRFSAYSLPAQQWSLEAGALGVGNGDVYAVMTVGYGLGKGVQLNANLAHASVGLLNLTAGWHFIDTRYFDLGARLGAWYGHGEWFWIATPTAKKILSKIDLFSLPLELTASSTPTSWLELDLGLQYTYARLFGAGSNEESVFTDNQLGMEQFFARPGARFFLADNTALEFFAKLPLYSAIPIEGGPNRTVPFERTWWLEGGLRSRFARTLYGSVRLHYAAISDVLYGARLYPSFEIEVRP
ncbi:MAG TPA: hypothetical protein VJV79_37385 [Polyangiaceae bacterium]|nr:hypothetical protein [Polyangiaceae bacterium]